MLGAAPFAGTAIVFDLEPSNLAARAAFAPANAVLVAATFAVTFMLWLIKRAEAHEFFAITVLFHREVTEPRP